ncbi:MAG: acetylornithine aminotransferase [Betaproteobacteria bacterium RIFCSPLOWO2_02_FULL_62_17]|nr:MAG: acetylornithine aminotransferase [Betaproteobacteria bacterium RIFCSPLOWO2_02_FULL_62_17]
MSHVMNTYSRLPLCFVRGEGVWLWDESGKRYLDALAGIAVNTLGHAHPKLVRALGEQISSVIHTSNLYRIAKQEALADKLAAISGMDKSFFCNSGCEANEAAIKLARLHGHRSGVESPAIMVMEQAFHGRTLATLSATGNRKVQAGFEPLVGGFVRVPFNDLETVRQIGEHDRSVVAVLVEPIQGEGGINVSTIEYLRGLREVCDKHGWLLMLDEVQCGIGRSGKWFVYQHAGILPDVMTLAKGLASGVPIGVCLARGAAAEVFKPGNHGSTFGGNPLASAAALATLSIIEEEGLIANAIEMGALICDGIADGLKGNTGVRAIRGRGLMIGVELDRACGDLVTRALERQLLINVTVDNVVRLLPPLTINRDEAGQIVSILVPLIREFLAQPLPQPAVKQ